MPSKTQSILIGALLTALLGTSVLGMSNILCCMPAWAGALAAVWHYTTTHDLTISAGDGVLIGVLAALIGAVAAGIINYVLALAGLDLATELQMNLMESVGASDNMIEQMRQQQANQGVGSILLGVGFEALLSALFGAIGGAIGASVFKRGGDTPGGGPGGMGGTGGGPGGPREPAGTGRSPSGGPQQARTSGSPSEAGGDASGSPEYRPTREKEEAPIR